MRNAIHCGIVALFAAGVAMQPTDAATTHRRHVHHLKPVAPSGIGVMMDQARLVTFDRPAKTIFIANPMIADINVVDARHAFVLGKTFGLTNLIALDKDGKQIESRQVTVMNHEAAVTLNRGPDQYNLSCTSAHCEITPRPGDPYEFFKNTEKAVSDHQDQSGKQALPPQGQGQNQSIPVD